MEVTQILREYRAGRDPRVHIKVQAGVLNARVVTRAGPAGYREEIERYLTEVLAEAGGMLALDRNMRISAELDAAQARAHWRSLRASIASILAKIEDDYPPSDACDDILRLINDHNELDGPDDDNEN